MEKVEISTIRYDELIATETTFRIIKDIIIRSDSCYSAHETIKKVLGLEEGKE